MSVAHELLNEPMGRKPERAPITPYTAARRHWDDRLGTVVMNAKHWRLGFFGLLFAVLGLSGGIPIPWWYGRNGTRPMRSCASRPH